MFVLARLLCPLWDCLKTTPCVTILLEQLLLNNTLLLKLSKNTVKTSKFVKVTKTVSQTTSVGSNSRTFCIDNYSTILCFSTASLLDYHLHSCNLSPQFTSTIVLEMFIACLLVIYRSVVLLSPGSQSFVVQLMFWVSCTWNMFLVRADYTWSFWFWVYTS